MEKFHYKTFLYNSIILEFEMTENFDKTSFELITTNYNCLMIQNGMGGKRFAGFWREITCSFQEDEFIEISNELYEEKVVPKNDLICGISPQQDEEIIKTEIPPSNWGPEYWKILEKIIKGQKKEEIDIDPQEYEDRKAYKAAANAVQTCALDLLKTFEDIQHVFAKTGAESETEARSSFKQVDQYKELQKRNTEEKQ
jgi:hypothetical protein